MKPADESLRINPAASPADLDAARHLLREYGRWLGADHATPQSFEQELAGLPGPYAAPAGCLLLARLAEAPAGCVALRDLGAGICELKRLWVRPAHQGRGLGLLLAEHIIAEARAIGYERVRLDTLPSRMAAAAHIYRQLGFRAIARYHDNPIAGVEYMELRLREPVK